jgi:hypothetical protein
MTTHALRPEQWLVCDPHWTPERLSPIALERLGFTRRR